jgi:hypothetical protein
VSVGLRPWRFESSQPHTDGGLLASSAVLLPPSSRGLGRRPLTAETGVRIPVAVLRNPRLHRGFRCCRAPPVGGRPAGDCRFRGRAVVLTWLAGNDGLEDAVAAPHAQASRFSTANPAAGRSASRPWHQPRGAGHNPGVRESTHWTSRTSPLRRGLLGGGGGTSARPSGRELIAHRAFFRERREDGIGSKLAAPRGARTGRTDGPDASRPSGANPTSETSPWRR